MLTSFRAVVQIPGNESIAKVELHLLMPTGEHDAAWVFAKRIAASLGNFAAGSKPRVTLVIPQPLPSPGEAAVFKFTEHTVEKLIASLGLVSQAWIARRAAKYHMSVEDVLRIVIAEGIKRLDEDTLDRLAAKSPANPGWNERSGQHGVGGVSQA